jgi:hypothetical protein
METDCISRIRLLERTWKRCLARINLKDRK